MLTEIAFEHGPPRYQGEFARILNDGEATAGEIDPAAVDPFDPSPRFLWRVRQPKLAGQLSADLLQFALAQDSKEIGPVDDTALALRSQALFHQPLATLC